MRPPSTILRTLAETRARIFQTTPPRPLGEPSSVRTGAKFLRKRLVGPSMLNYYPPTLSIKTVNSFLTAPGLRMHNETWKAPDGTVRKGLILPKELQRLKDVERKRAIGKGPPKKGESMMEVGLKVTARLMNSILHYRPGTTCDDEGQEEVRRSIRISYCTLSIHSLQGRLLTTRKRSDFLDEQL